jgi:hypothetical protein
MDETRREDGNDGVHSGALFQGLVAGLIGYVIVAGFFVALNLVLGRPATFTAGVLGTALVGGATAHVGAVIAFNGVHILASMVMGVAAALLIYETELHPRAWFAFFFVFVAGFVFTSVVAGVVAAEMTEAAPWWAVIFSNLLAAGLSVRYLLSRHPWLSATVRDVAEA